MRLDQLLVQQGHTQTRTQAQALIESGAVEVLREGQWILATKSSMQCHEQETIRITQMQILKYVSRGGLKLEGALQHLSLNVQNLKCLDVGLSTGGFSDCLLKKGAKQVVGIDVGRDQVHPSLQKNQNLIYFDELHVKELRSHPLFLKTIPQAGFDLIVIDVSFISLTLVLNEILFALSPEGAILALVKPQFEVGPQGLKKGGLVKDESSYALVQEKIKRTCHDLELNVLDFFPSELTGKDGNREFFIYLKSNN